METRFDKVTVKNQSFRNLSDTVMQLRGSGTSQMLVSFDSVADMRFCFTDMRMDLLKALSENGPLTMGELAARLKRNRTAVARDVSALARTGVIEIERVVNPGHGRVTMVKPLARHYQFVWDIGAEQRKTAAKAAAKPAKRRAA
jgi:predicted transcriptional regulator